MSDFEFVGVDIAKDKFDAVVLKEKSSEHQIFQNNKAGFKAFIIWLKKITTSPWICMEATGHYSEPLADYLHSKEICISVVNPLQIKNFAKALLSRNKNDKLDANIIAQYCKHMRPRVFLPRSIEQKTLRELVQLIDTLKEQRILLNNQLRSTKTTSAKNSYHLIIKSLNNRIKRLEKKLDDIVKNNGAFSEMVTLLISVKGIGRACAYRVIAYLPNINSFDNAKQFAAFIGVTPRQFESGKMKGKTCMTHFGHARFKKVLYMPALVAKNKNEHLQPFVLRLQKNGLAPKAIVGAVMRKLAHIIFGILKSKKPFDHSLACAA